MISPMLFKKLIQICSEELQKAKRAIVTAYEIIRETDERTMEFLLVLLGLR
jgi:hypothetical protein